MFIIFSLAAVHYNTIIHPYTLADNRHYVFYVFRILRLYPAFKYVAVPIYYLCAGLAVRALQNCSSTSRTSTTPTSHNRAASSPAPVHTSFLFIWLLSTTLSVATAPLVEPRYFIIPWVIWRVHVPYVSDQGMTSTAVPKGKGNTTSTRAYDMRLVLETMWLMCINVVVGYMFLYREFEWESENGKAQRFLW